MSGFSIKSTFFALAMLGMASTTFAADGTLKGNAQKAFDLLAEYPAESSEPNYIKLQSFISMEKAAIIDAKLTKRYGDPETSREGLKVWEITHPNPKRGHTTIMCGPDGNGGLHISADRRRKDKISVSASSEQKTRLTNTQSRPSPSISLRSSQAPSSPQVE